MSESDSPLAPGKVRLGPNGRIVIPAALRDELGLEPGVTLFLDVKDGVLHIESLPARIRRVQREFSPFKKAAVLASDELIAERRAESLREEGGGQRATKRERPKSEEKIA